MDITNIFSGLPYTIYITNRADGTKCTKVYVYVHVYILVVPVHFCRIKLTIRVNTESIFDDLRFEYFSAEKSSSVSKSLKMKLPTTHQQQQLYNQDKSFQI